ncbi:hypothetical protein [Desulfopila aestuarii]|uniref:hypothetical protein n=1 Tax=Desulfopila aestuarii TaxID=231440 RepID=UPI0011612711|nr:hypothetical protein [Desulfopila aestuarii]
MSWLNFGGVIVRGDKEGNRKRIGINTAAANSWIAGLCWTSPREARLPASDSPAFHIRRLTNA